MSGAISSFDASSSPLAGTYYRDREHSVQWPRAPFPRPAQCLFSPPRHDEKLRFTRRLNLAFYVMVGFCTICIFVRYVPVIPAVVRFSDAQLKIGFQIMIGRSPTFLARLVSVSGAWRPSILDWSSNGCVKYKRRRRTPLVEPV